MATDLIQEKLSSGYASDSVRFQLFRPGGWRNYIARAAVNLGFGFNKSGLFKMFTLDRTRFVSFAYAITVQGTTGATSTVTISLKDIFGDTITGTTGEVLRVRVCNSAGYTNATNATIAAGANTTNVTSLTNDKDLVLTKQADFWTITFTNGTAETATLRVGLAPLSTLPGDYTATQNVTHAAP